MRTPRAPGIERDTHLIVIVLKDTAETSLLLSSFWLPLLKLDKISLSSDASISIFWHPFIVNHRRTSDLRESILWTFLCRPLPSLPCTAITSHTACWVEFTSQRPSKVTQPNFLAFSHFRESLSVLGAAGASWKPHDPHQTVRLPQRTCRLLYAFASCSMTGQIALFPQSHLLRACKAFRVAHRWFHILKNPQTSWWYMGQTWCYLWYLRDDWSVTLSLLCGLCCVSCNSDWLW